MTPGWVQFRHKVFKGWDKGLANENFPRHTGGAVVLDAIGFMDRLHGGKAGRVSGVLRLDGHPHDTLPHFAGPLQGPFERRRPKACVNFPRKEKQTKKMPWVNEDMCTGCGTCEEECPAGAIALTDGIAVHRRRQVHPVRRMPRNLPGGRGPPRWGKGPHGSGCEPGLGRTDDRSRVLRQGLAKEKGAARTPPKVFQQGKKSDRYDHRENLPIAEFIVTRLM